MRAIPAFTVLCWERGVVDTILKLNWWNSLLGMLFPLQNIPRWIQECLSLWSLGNLHQTFSKANMLPTVMDSQPLILFVESGASRTLPPFHLAIFLFWSALFNLRYFFSYIFLIINRDNLWLFHLSVITYTEAIYVRVALKIFIFKLCPFN